MGKVLVQQHTSVELLQMRKHDDKLKWRDKAEHPVFQTIAMQMIAQHSKAQSPEKISCDRVFTYHSPPRNLKNMVMLS